MTSINLILGGVSCAFCGVEVSPSRAGGFHAPQTETHGMKIRLPASHSNPVAILQTSGGGPLRLAIDATRSFKHLASRIFSSRGPSLLIQNLCRRLQASGGLSFLRIPFVDHCSEATNSIFRRFQIPPIGRSLSPAVHGQTMQHKDTRDHGNSYPQHG